jgi:hypothetical protein
MLFPFSAQKYSYSGLAFDRHFLGKVVLGMLNKALTSMIPQDRESLELLSDSKLVLVNDPGGGRIHDH